MHFVYLADRDNVRVIRAFTTGPVERLDARLEIHLAWLAAFPLDLQLQKRRRRAVASVRESVVARALTMPLPPDCYVVVHYMNTAS